VTSKTLSVPILRVHFSPSIDLPRKMKQLKSQFFTETLVLENTINNAIFVFPLAAPEAKSENLLNTPQRGAKGGQAREWYY
jgi:hypothetical protein